MVRVLVVPVGERTRTKLYQCSYNHAKDVYIFYGKNPINSVHFFRFHQAAGLTLLASALLRYCTLRYYTVLAAGTNGRKEIRLYLVMPISCHTRG